MVFVVVTVTMAVSKNAENQHQQPHLQSPVGLQAPQPQPSQSLGSSTFLHATAAMPCSERTANGTRNGLNHYMPIFRRRCRRCDSCKQRAGLPGRLRAALQSFGYWPVLPLKGPLHNLLAGLSVRLGVRFVESRLGCFHGWVVRYLLIEIWGGNDFVRAIPEDFFS